MRGSRILAAAALVVGGALLAGCTGTPAPVHSTAATRTLRAADVAKKIADTELSTASIAQADGALSVNGAPVKVRIDVESVRSLADSTLLTWRLSTVSGAQEKVSTFQFAVAPHLDTRNVALVVDGGATTLRPYTFRYQNDPSQPTSCLCATIPSASDGTGLQLNALMPALPAGTKTVDVSFPGFDVMKGVPVTR
ncbi:hypothetical protein GCM10023171_13930 [Microbacterium panaciterrae]|uniref:DUF4352 domain-containing protein n=2 Tax=Microbacterium panaciterrae TaxID=985759 RepID=A0ABP8PAF4_9MICO